jgi:hypothetical protein
MDEFPFGTVSKLQGGSRIWLHYYLFLMKPFFALNACSNSEGFKMLVVYLKACPVFQICQWMWLLSFVADLAKYPIYPVPIEKRFDTLQ